MLVPVNADDPEELPVGLVEMLRVVRVVVLGYYPVPDQASPEQLRADHEPEAAAAVEAAAERFAGRGADVESLVVFTHDWSETVDRVAAEHDVDAVLTTGECDSVDRVFVPLRGEENLERIVSFVGDVLRGNEATVTLYNVASGDDEATRGELLLRGACDRLEEDGIDPRRVEWRLEEDGSPDDAIVAAADDYDVLVVGESEPSLRDRIFGRTTGDIVDRVVRPVLVVRDR